MMRSFGVLFALLLVCASAAADSYKMGVIDIEQLTPSQYRVMHQYSGANELLTLTRPNSCEQLGAQRQQPLRKGLRTEVIWDCAINLQNPPLSLDPLPVEGLQYYLNWRADDQTLDSQPVTTWPVIAERYFDHVPDRVNYLWMGITHILAGWDHLAFVLGLLMLVTGWRRLLAVITAFTVGHSLTLVLATIGVLRVSPSLVETLIPLSIVFLFAEALQNRQTSWIQRFPEAVAAFFGLFHGLGFASALADIGVPQDGRFWPLVQFNVGVEFGQVLFVLAVLPVQIWLMQPARQPVRRSLIAVMGLCAGYWTAERCAVLLA